MPQVVRESLDEVPLLRFLFCDGHVDRHVVSDASLVQERPRIDIVIWWHTLRKMPLDQDVIWFVDNQGAASSLAKGASGSADIDRIVSLSHLL